MPKLIGLMPSTASTDNRGSATHACHAARDRSILPSEELAALTAELRSVNKTLWEIEDEIRCCERDNDLGPRLIALARSVYQSNDRRATVKRRINERLGSKIVGEKSYGAAM
jgi:hypothetical protein